jgi:opacity protein-like surface antigen
MRTFKLALLATVATAALSSATLAADLIIDAPEMYAPAASYGLDGPYVGFYVLGDSHTTSFGGGVVLGANFAQDSFLLGVEGDLSITTVPDWYAQVIGKAGFMAGDSAAIYGLVGVGWTSDHAGRFYVPVGVGAEFAVSDNLSLKGQVEYHWTNTAGAHDTVVGKLGLNWRF